MGVNKRLRFFFCNIIFYYSMPYIIRKIRNQPYYSVKNAETGKVHSEHTSRKNALAQVRLLQNIGGMRRHTLFGNTGEPVPQRPPTPDMRERYSLGRRADELFRREQALAGPAPARVRAPAPAPYAPASSSSSASSASSASFASRFSMTPTVGDVYTYSDIRGFIADMEAGRSLPQALQNIYDTLTSHSKSLAKAIPKKRIAFAVAFHNLGYNSTAIDDIKRYNQLTPLINHITSNYKTIIPATLGSGYGGAKGVRGKNLHLKKLFDTVTVRDSGIRIPAPKMDLKEFQGMQRVFPQNVARAKKAFKGTEDAREDALFKLDMAKLKRKPNKWSGAPETYKDTSTVPLAEMMRRSAVIGRERPDTFEV